MMQRTMVAVSVLAAAVLAAAGFATWRAASGSAETGTPLTGAAVRAEPGRGGEPGGAAAREVPAPVLDRLRASADATVLAILADGVVTRDEVAGAFAAADACTRSAAAEVGGVTIGPATFTDPDGVISFGGASSASKEALDRVGSAHLACVERLFSPVLEAWQAGPAYAAHQAAWDRMAECLAAKGYATRPGMDLRQMAEAVGPGAPAGDVAACQAAARQ